MDYEMAGLYSNRPCLHCSQLVQWFSMLVALGQSAGADYGLVVTGYRPR